MSKVNPLGQQILKSKYLAADEKTPEDLFFRVARVGSIPDVIDYIYAQDVPKDERYFAPTQEDTLRAIFDPYTELAKRVIQRRGIDTAKEIPQRRFTTAAEQWKVLADKYYAAMCELDFMPATPVLINAGRGGMLSSCFFLRVPDSMEGIFDTVKKVGLISKAGGGVGLDVSLLRPSGALVGSSGGTSSGPISFLRIFNTACEAIRSGGIRRAALLGAMSVYHPDILEFIHCKEKEGELSNFNLSVFVDNNFMAAVKGNKEIVLQHEKSPIKKTVPALDIWNELVKHAWHLGDPGIIFEDTLNNADIFHGKIGKFGVNPCITGDTLVAVADGRGTVPIKQLMEEGKDVPVPCLSKDNKIEVRYMRNIRCTGENQKVIKLKLSNGMELTTTPNHKLLNLTQFNDPWGVVTTSDYYEASTLKEGCKLLTFAHKNGQIMPSTTEILEVEEWHELERGETVYNGTVDDFHNYFTTTKQANSLIINNKNCGELPLRIGECCTLSAINLANCFNEQTKSIDTDKIQALTKLGIQFLDNLVDLNNYPLPEIEQMSLKTRKVGLGTTGLHDLLLKLEISYGGNSKCLQAIDTIYTTIRKTAFETSIELGKVRGVPEELKNINIHRRNSELLTCQPAGTISQICNQVSSGIEPVFQWEYTRKDTFGTHKMKHFMLDKFGSEESLPEYAKTALEISPKDHIKVQAQLQKWIDQSISKTINAPNEATIDDVDYIYRLAHKLGCKSITVYRSGSRKDEVLIKKDPKEVPIEEKTIAEDEETTVNNIEAEVDNIDNLLDKPTSRPRPSVLFGATFKINTPGGKAYITINEDNRGIREVFIHISKAGSEIATHVEAEGRLISHSLKHGIPADTIISHLAGHKSNPIFDSGRSVKSVPDAVALVMQEYKAKFEGFSEFIETEQRIVTAPTKPVGEISGELCPECGEVLYMASGCTECASCGFSQCG